MAHDSLNTNFLNFSVWFSITITGPKKCAGLRKGKAPSNDCHVTKTVSKGTHIKCMKRQLWRMLCL